MKKRGAIERSRDQNVRPFGILSVALSLQLEGPSCQSFIVQHGPTGTSADRAFFSNAA